MNIVDHVVIIYNPNSTRSAAANAKKLARRLENKTDVNVHIVRTNHSSHAEELAGEYATTYENILIISSSGDGGYHEVINGVLTSGASAVATGLLPSGYANDHYRWMHRGRLIKRVNEAKTQPVDIIEVAAGDSYVRYAHSYVGLGISAQAAKLINQDDEKPSSEVASVLKAFSRITPIKIKINDEEQSYTNLIVANIGKMSKYFSIDGVDSTDGKLEIIRNKKDKPTELATQMARAMTFGLGDVEQVTSLEFVCLEPTIIQMDGEVHELQKNEPVTVRCRKQLLKTII